MIANEPLINIMALALALTAVYTVLLVVTAIVAPTVANRGLISASRETRDIYNQRISKLESRISKLESQNAELTAKNIELAMRNNELATMLKSAQNEMIKMQEQIWELRQGDDPTANS
jgi:septal ring factor EnvC (AmiA/AmiB activator)